MILILGSERDPEALAARSFLGPSGAMLLSVRDLSCPGWKLNTSAPGQGSFVAEGSLCQISAISGVLVRRFAVYPQELSHIMEEDREYVAAELTALLMWWLATLPVPVVNGPGEGSLCGPGWRQEKWRCTAAALGIPAIERIRCSTKLQPIDTMHVNEVLVLNGTVIKYPSPKAAESALRLADAAGCKLLQAAFNSEGEFVFANAMPAPCEELLRPLDGMCKGSNQ